MVMGWVQIWLPHLSGLPRVSPAFYRRSAPAITLALHACGNGERSVLLSRPQRDALAGWRLPKRLSLTAAAPTAAAHRGAGARNGRRAIQIGHLAPIWCRSSCQHDGGGRPITVMQQSRFVVAGAGNQTSPFLSLPNPPRAVGFAARYCRLQGLHPGSIFQFQISEQHFISICAGSSAAVPPITRRRTDPRAPRWSRGGSARGGRRLQISRFFTRKQQQQQQQQQQYVVRGPVLLRV